MSRLFTRREVADYLNININTVDKWARDKVLTRVKIGKSVRYDRYDLERLVRDRKDRS